jgi:hypothetical protein
VGELLAGIVAQLNRENDMLSMALVSRAFEDVGLNATWYKIGDHKLKRLLSLLPVDLWAQSGDVDSDMVRRPHRARAGRRLNTNFSQQLARPLTIEDISRFRFYAKRVVWASLGDPGGPTISRTLLRARLLAQYDIVRPILPRLRILDWSWRGHDPFIAQIFFHGGLHTFKLREQNTGVRAQPQRPALALLTALAPHSAQLRSLILSAPPFLSDGDVSDHLEAFLGSAVGLEVFKMQGHHGARASTLRLLASMPHLVDLTLSGCDLDVLASPMTHHPPEYSFPALRLLEGRVQEADKLGELLERITSTELTEIKMWTFGPCSALTFYAFAESLGRQPHRRASIQVLQLFFQREGRRVASEPVPAGDEDQYTLTLGGLRPILNLSHLTDLSIVSPLLAVDDTMLQAIAAHLPALAKLCLDDTAAPPNRILCTPSSPTLAGVATLLSGCPRLRYFAIAVNTSSVHDWTYTPQRSAWRCLLCLLHADIQESSVEPLVQAFCSLGVSLGGPSPQYYFDNVREEAVVATGLNWEEFRAEFARRFHLWLALNDRMNAIWP